MRWTTASEALEARALLAVTPAVTINAPDDAFIGSDVNLSVAFDNTGSGSETGYGPIIDVVLPVNGIDGGASPDGLNTTGPATYLGVPITTIELTFPNDGGGTGTVNHPFFVNSSGAPLTVTGNAGDKLVVIQLPFGSFTPDQPAAPVQLPLTMSNLADLNAPLTIRTRSGFQYGADPLDNPGSDPSLVSDAPVNSSTWSVSHAVNPILTRLSKQNLAPESEAATGPNFPRQYEIVVEIAEGQTITNFDVTDLLPPEIVYLGNGTVNVSPALSPSIISSPPTGAPNNAPNNDLTVRIPTVTGGSGNTGFTLTYGFFVNQFNASSTAVINATTADDTLTLNEAFAIGDWTPIDTRDAGGTNNVVAHENVALHDDELENQAIAVQKSVSIVTDTGASGATPGDVLEYVLEFQVSDYFAFHDVFLNDLLSDGQRIDDTFTPRLFVQEHGDTSSLAAFAGVNFTIADNFTGTTDAGAAAGSGPSHTVAGGVPAGSQEARFRISNELVTRGGGFADGQLVGGAIANGGTGGPAPPSAAPLPFGGTIGRIVYRTIIQDDFSDDFPSGDASVDIGDVLTNTAVIDGAVLNVSDLTPNGNREDDDTAAQIEIARGTLQKQIYAINGGTTFVSPILVAPGDTVTYRLLLDLPTSDIEDLAFIDYLPLPVFASGEVSGPFDSTISAAVPAAGTAKFGPTETFYPISQAVLGGAGLVPGISTDADGNSVTFNYGDFDDPSNRASQIDILFTVTVSDDPFADGLFLTNQVRQVETSTNAGNAFEDAIVQIQLGEPELNIRKGVVGSDSGGTFSPSTVGPLAFSAPGAGDNDATTPEFSGTINSTNLSATPINSNLSGVDAGDIVKFAVVVENTGSSRLGAFDVSLRDTIPTGFTVPGSGLNLSVTDGTGATLTFADLGGGLFGSGIQLNDPGATLAVPVEGTNGGAIDEYNATSGRNIVVITYDLQLIATVSPGSNLTNTATLMSYAGDEGAANHIPGGVTDTAQVTVARPVVDKVVTTTNQAHTSDNNVAIGEIVTYTVTVTVPEGRSASTQLVDTLDAGLAFVDLVSITPSSGTLTSSAGSYAAIASAATFGSVGAGAANAGRRMTLDFGTLTNSDTNNATDETLTLVYRAVVLNTTGNVRAQQRNNSAAWNWTGESVFDAAPNVTIVEPTLDVTKTMSPASADAGDTVTITITLQHAVSSNANAFEVTLSDVLPGGLSYVSGSLSHSAGAAPTSGPTESGGTITAAWTNFPLGTTSTLTLQATLLTSVIPGTTITNTANADWTGLPGDVTATQSIHNTLAVERTGDPTGPGTTANTYVDSGSDTVDVTAPAPVKSIVETSEAHTVNGAGTTVDPARVAVGEIIRYRLQTSIPEGTSPNLLLIDTLPNGLSLLDLSQVMVSFSADNDITEPADLAGADSDAIAPTFVLPAGRIGTSGQTVTFDLGTLVNNDSDAGAELVTLEFNVLVTNTAVIQNAVQRSNSFIVQVNGTNVATSNSVVSQVVEPAITNVTKTVTSFATGSVTYQVTFSNTGTATAFDVRMNDSLPSPALTLNVGSVSVTPAGGTAGITDTSSGNDVGIAIDTIPVGGSITITYTASVNSATQSAAIPNTAAVTYTSLPVDGTTVNATGSSTPANSERTGADGPGGALHDYADNDSASLGALGDRVWYDVNGDDVQDAGEPGIGGVTMTLTWFGPNGTLGGGDDVTVTRTTASDGSYQFVGLPAGNFRVQANTGDLPAGMTQTFDFSGSQTDSTSNRTLTGGEIAVNQDFGYTGTGSIGDTVWYDADSNDAQNNGEPGIPGVTVTLNIDFDRNGSTDVVLIRVTDQNGNYTFPNLPFADYTVVVTQPAGTTQTYDASGSQTDNTSALTLSGGENNTAQDFGYVGTGSIGDFIWLDRNGDAIQDADEPGLANVTVTLELDVNSDGNPDYTEFTTTDASGQYLFSDLIPGAYTVIVTPPANLTQTADPDATLNNRSTVNLAAGTNNVLQDFGYRGTGTIGDYIYRDENGSGTEDGGDTAIDNATVNLSGDIDGDGIAETFTTMTNGSGIYSFTNLPVTTPTGAPILYTAAVDPASLPTTVSPFVDPDGTADNQSTVTLTVASPTNDTMDFGYVELVDLAITKTNTDVYRTRLPDEPVVYELVVTNAGPGPAVNASVVDNLPAEVTSVSWTATGSAGTTFSASGSGDLNETVFVPVGGTINYIVSATIDPSFLGILTNTATVSTVQLDTDLTNNSDSDVTQIAPIVVTPLNPPVAGQPITFSARGQGLHTALVPFAWGTSLGTSVVNGVTLGIANATVFGVGVQCSGGTVEATLSLPASLAGQTIYVQAFETQPDRLASNVLPLNVGASTPVVTAPSGSLQTARPTFTWTPAAGAISYDVWIGTMPAAASPYMRQTVAGTSWTPPTDLNIGRYAVHVQGIRADGSRTGWSVASIFEVDTRVQWITNSGSAPSQQPTINWNAVIGAARYDVWFNNLSTGASQVVRDMNVAGTSFTPPTPLPLGAYRIWVRAFDAVGNAAGWSTGLQVGVTPAPLPTGPAAVTVDSTPTFDWNDVAGATAYDLWVNNTTTGISQIIRQTSLTTSEFTPSASLPGGRYLWWVRASANGAVGSWSAGQTFHLGGAPTLLTPGATTGDTTPTFTWTAVDGAATYRLWVNRVGGQSGIINENAVVGTSFTALSALPSGNYRVWLRAVGVDGTLGNWSTAVDFTITANDPATDDDELLEVVLLQTADLLEQRAVPVADERFANARQRNRDAADANDSFDKARFAAADRQSAVGEWTARPAVNVRTRQVTPSASVEELTEDMASLDEVLSQLHLEAMNG